MSRSAQERPTARALVAPLAIGVAMITAVIAGMVVSESVSSSATTSPSVPLVENRDAGPGADGTLPDGTTAFDDRFPGIANLDSHLLDAIRAATSAAADDGVDVVVNSGWRSAEYQNHLLREAVAEYGSETEAARWVATPETSAHVSGHAVDIGYVDAMSWLSQHGSAYDLCQTYANELWHYEYVAGAREGGCPEMYTDPTQDPRMH